MRGAHHALLVFLTLFTCSLAFKNALAQNVAINSTGNAPAASAILDIAETGKGILIPRMTLANRPASPATGLLIYQTNSTPGFYYYNGSGWVAILGGTGTGGIYGGSGSLTADPTTVTMGTNNLAFTSTVINGFSVDGTTFSIDAASNLVGIGTATPAQPLTVIGDILMGGTSTDYDGNSEGIKIIARADNWYLGVQNETTVGASDFFIGLNDDTEDGMFHIQNDGNIGIGTLAPSSKLHVSGGTGSVDLLIEADTDNSGEGDQPSLTLSQDGGAVIGKLGYFSSTNLLTLKNTYNDALRFGTNNLDRVSITGAGDVGIGTTSPSAKLDVVGVLELSGTAPSDPGSDIVRLGDGGTNLRIQTNYGYTTIGPANTSWSHFGTDRARYYFDKGITVDQGLIGSYDENLSLQTSGTTRITALTSNGYVGIGETSPAYALEVAGTFGYGDGTSGTYRSRTETRADAGLVASQSGFYQTSAPSPAANWPAGASGWWHLLDVRHSNNANNYGMQIAGGFFDQDFWVRKTNNSASTAWAQMITTANVGSYGDNLGNHIATEGIKRSDHHYGHLEGSYNNVAANSAKTNPIYTIGSSYNPTATALSNMYGIGYSHDNFWTVGSGTTGWGMYVAADGDIRHILDASTGVAWASGSMRSPIFYDSDNTGYYLNPASSTAAYLAGSIAIDGNTVIDDGAGWHRSYGSTGWYNGTHGGGIYMIDATWIRTYGNKSFYHNTGTMRTDGTFQVGPGGDRMIVQTNGNVGVNGTPNGNNNFFTSLQDATTGTAMWANTSANSSWVTLESSASSTTQGTGISGTGYTGVSGSSTSGAGWAGYFDYDTYIDWMYYWGATLLSDRRLKHNIRDIDDGLKYIIALNPVVYEKIRGIVQKPPVKSNAKGFEMEEENIPEFGLIAQEVEKILPELVSSKDMYIRGQGKLSIKGINYDGMIPIMIKATQQQQEIIEEQNRTIEELKDRITRLENGGDRD